MLRLNQYWFYSLGSKIHPLTQIQDDARLSSIFWPLWTARVDLESTFDQFPLRVSRNAASALHKAITDVIPVEFSEALKAQEPDTPIGFLPAHNIRESALAFETVLAAELQVLDTYLVSQKGTHSTPDLIDHGELMVPYSLRSDLPSQAITDLQAAGRCLAFSVPTATAFHGLRAAESVIRLYYEEVIGVKPRPKMRNWGAYVKRLNEAGADNRITGFIDHVRDLYRNPVFHPEDNLSSEDALVFLGTCVALICKILLETQRLRKDPAHSAGKVARTMCSGKPIIDLITPSTSIGVNSKPAPAIEAQSDSSAGVIIEP
jgi:hypothetical protein